MGKLNSFFCLFLFWFAATSASDPEGIVDFQLHKFNGVNFYCQIQWGPNFYFCGIKVLLRSYISVTLNKM